MKPIVFSWNSFTAPACKTCNDSFAKLEGAAKACVLLLLAGKPISGEAIDVLLRWFDKVRVGLWLLNNVLGGGPLSVAPAFAIRDRMDTADRAVVVVRTSGPTQGLTIIGPSSPIFPFMPSCVGIVINGLALINVSTRGLLGERAGFPWLDVRRVITNGQLEVAVKKPTDRVQAPLLELEPIASFVRVDRTQPVLAQWSVLPSWGGLDGLLSEWCCERLLRPGLSRPIACRSDSTDYVSTDAQVQALGEAVREPREISRLVLETQLSLLRNLKDRRPVFDAAIKLTETMLSGV